MSDNNWSCNVKKSLSEDLSRQSLGRPLNDSEAALAASLGAIFGSGQHDFGKVAEELQSRGVAKPSGIDASWTPSLLEEELRAINSSLDDAHQRGGFTPLD
ncbi:recombinase-like helix-turn-helix domain-containing protein [Sphingorhabdus sp.]|uniref:recombinase-like helix-turn-helix domain-containing protein n=1 Tax=Sphingorhabdus sp. TaxID=1902408 RepID=UPI0037CC6660